MNDDLNTLHHLDIPEPSAEAKDSTMQMAMQAFEKHQKEKLLDAGQGSEVPVRPIHSESSLTKWIRSFDMKKGYGFAGSFAAVALLAVTTTYYSDILREVNPTPQTVDVVAPQQPTEQAVTVKNDQVEPGVRDIVVEGESTEAVQVESVAPVLKQAKKESNIGADADVNMNAPGMGAGSTARVAASAPPPVAYNAKPEMKAARSHKPMAEEITAGSAADMTSPAPGMAVQSSVARGYLMPEPHPPVVYGGGDRFEQVAANQAKLVASEPVSTFSIDVDTASYAFVRRMLNQGQLPSASMVRAEEMINYFDYNYTAPTGAHPFAPNITVMPSPWHSAKKLVHIGIKGQQVHHIRKPSSNLVFLIDVSGSMNSHDKLPLVKSSLHMLVDQMGEDDRIAIVTYAGYAGTALHPTSGADKQKIRSVIDRLGAGGGTAGAAGIEQAYNLAAQHKQEGGVNRVILATDGDFNVGMSNNEQLKHFIEQKRETGISLSVLGFGQGNYNDALMQSLAQHGNGNAAYIDSLTEARKVLVNEANATLHTIAKDVKIQVEWNPATVADYRLVGYETRMLKREDFNNDKIDAGEVGAGHTVTAIYEITPAGEGGSVDPLRYGGQPQAEKAETNTAFVNEYGFLKIRYKQPEGTKSTLMTTSIDKMREVSNVAQAPADARFATAVAGFAQKLQGASALQGVNYHEIIRLADGARAYDPHGLRAEFVNLVRTAQNLSGGGYIQPVPEPYPGGSPISAPTAIR